MGSGNLLLNKLHPVAAFQPRDINTLPTEDYVSMSNYEHGGILLMVGDVQGDFDVTLKQAQDVAGTGEKELIFSKAYQVADTAGAGALADTWEDRTVTSGGATGCKVTVAAATDDNLLLFIPFHAAMLDLDNDFTSLRVDVTDPAATAMVAGIYLMGGARYGGPAEVHVSAVVD